MGARSLSDMIDRRGQNALPDKTDPLGRATRKERTVTRARNWRESCWTIMVDVLNNLYAENRWIVSCISCLQVFGRRPAQLKRSFLVVAISIVFGSVFKGFTDSLARKLRQEKWAWCQRRCVRGQFRQSWHGRQLCLLFRKIVCRSELFGSKYIVSSTWN